MTHFLKLPLEVAQENKLHQRWKVRRLTLHKTYEWHFIIGSNYDL